MTMVQHHKTALKSQAGFTLVELAIVMIIIGLLIGGVLKGQQLITNAQITATVAQVKAIDAATTSFRDQYNAVPGDLAAATATARIPNCNAANNCAIAGVGNGDGRVGTASITFGAAPAGEQLQYWGQLSAARLITGVNPALGLVWGGYAPASKITGGGFDIGWYAGGSTLSGLEANPAAGNAPAGEYLALHGTAAAVVGGAAADTFLTVNQAARVDTKLDDGAPNAGTVWAASTAFNVCASTPIATAVYNESTTGTLCALFIKFQN